MQSNNIFSKLLGDGPYPFPTEKIADNLEIHCTDDVCACVFKHRILFNDDLTGHSHNSYEFIIPYSPMPNIHIEKKALNADANTLISINPNQPHGPGSKMSIDSMIAVHIDSNYLKEVSYQANNSSYFFFDNAAPSSFDHVKYLMQCFINESKNKQAGYKFILESLSSQISVNLLRNAKYSSSKRSQVKNFSDNKDINKVIEFFREHYASNNYSSAEIAKLANLSPYHFIRAFKQHTGKTPYEYLIDIKIEKAKEMLRHNHCSITEVCYSCGFTNHSHFSTLFKKRLGVTPTEYRSI